MVRLTPPILLCFPFRSFHSLWFVVSTEWLAQCSRKSISSVTDGFIAQRPCGCWSCLFKVSMSVCKVFAWKYLSWARPVEPTVPSTQDAEAGSSLRCRTAWCTEWLPDSHSYRVLSVWEMGREGEADGRQTDRREWTCFGCGLYSFHDFLCHCYISHYWW